MFYHSACFVIRLLGADTLIFLRLHFALVLNRIDIGHFLFWGRGNPLRFQYFQPHVDIRSLVSSYYDVSVVDSVSDKMRAEIANVRFIISGKVTSDINGTMEDFERGTTMLCGPTFHWSHAKFAADTVVFGAAITPLGWARLFDIPAYELADRIVPLENYIPPSGLTALSAIFGAGTALTRVAACDRLFASCSDIERRIDDEFLNQVTAWITSPDPSELSDLLDRIALSPRQIERLCKKYFGSAPKLLHRKFRALHSANRLTWRELTDWREIATTAYSDQSHFSREFKQFNGRTPSEFIQGAHILVRMTLQERLQIAHESPFSLIG
jgi:AraC-like DNA-binding protein